jgi:DNA damage-binding protein 1
MNANGFVPFFYQGQVVTCSGAFKDGSLRVVRNGIGINEHAAIELDGIKGIWSVNPAAGAQYEKYLIVAFVGEVRSTVQTRIDRYLRYIIL